MAEEPKKIRTGCVGVGSLVQWHARIYSEMTDLELVGVYAHGADKVGVDAAELAGWPTPTGIKATNDIGELIALRPDACCYNPLWPDIDELVALLESGINVCSSAAWIPSTASMRTGRRISGVAGPWAASTASSPCPDPPARRRDGRGRNGSRCPGSSPCVRSGPGSRSPTAASTRSP